ncbi:MAG TPA: hypothetical protein VMU29_08650 [Smithella sp.]|nr:hypothetical protein [Smithella sp.]
MKKNKIRQLREAIPLKYLKDGQIGRSGSTNHHKNGKGLANEKKLEIKSRESTSKEL